jgi:hypothetical protein
MRVKLFWRNRSKPSAAETELESEINVWLQQNPNIKVSDIKQSSCDTLFFPPVVISIWYEESVEP